MAEKEIVIDNEKVKYTGVFDAKGLIKLVKTWAKDHGYFMYEPSHTETVKPSGRHVDMRLIPMQKFTDYVKGTMLIIIQMRNVKDVTLKKKNKKLKLQEGEVVLKFKGQLERDYEDRWESKPLFYVLRTLFHKYIYSPMINKYESTVKGDVKDLKSDVKSYLNFTKF